MLNLCQHHPLPNIRRFFVPDPGYTICDSDLDRADLQVVAWEADEPELKAALRKGVDVHLLNAFAIMGKEVPDLDWLVEAHSEYPSIRHSMERGRKLAKAWCHGTNYGGSARTMAIAAGITTRESEMAQSRYFGRYPGIKRWHLRVEDQLARTRTVTNKFGYRRVYFDRVEGLLPEALAWIPQSTVALYINKIWDAVEDVLPLEILLQVHDSLVWQAQTPLFQQTKVQFKEIASKIIIPYDDPLVIPVGFKSSEESWGACH